MNTRTKGKSLRWVLMLLLIAVGCLGWALAAARYAADVEGWSFDRHTGDEIVVVNPAIEFLIGGARFFGNAVVQISNAHRVVWHTVTARPGLLFVLLMMVGGVGAFGWWVKRVERNLAEEDRRLKRRFGKS